MGKEKLLVSSCLLGELVKYNGHHNLLDKQKLKELEKSYDLYPFCPEVEGGLSIPRIPCEIVSTDPLKVINKEGIDQTKEFLNGAEKALEFCNQEGIKKALLKENSPSCGSNTIYNGSFDGIKIDGQGVTTTLLREAGIKVLSEEELERFIY